MNDRAVTRALGAFLVSLVVSLGGHSSTLVAAPATKGEHRLALVIGNAGYASAPLRNPINDARAISRALKKLGFEVIKLEDATKTQVERGILDFVSRVRPESTALFYYAGHGLQVRGRNFIVPVDAELTSESSVRVEGVELQLLLEELEIADSRINLVILDACRNNPFASATRSVSRGLAVVNAASGTLIAYATAPGSVAADGQGRNGLYTEELIQALQVPGLPVEGVFKQVRGRVQERSRGQQIPWESSSLTGHFVFNPQPEPITVAKRPTPTAPVTPQAAAQANDSALDLAFWSSIQASDDPAAFQAYLDRFPKGTFVTLASLKLAKLDDAGDEPNSTEAAQDQAIPEMPQQTSVTSTDSAQDVSASARPEAAQSLEARLDQQIDELIAKAATDVQALRLTSPPGANAYERYRAVLVARPGQQDALRGLEAIVDRYIALTARAITESRFDKARTYLARAKRVSPDSSALIAATSRLSAAEQAHRAQKTALAAKATPPTAPPGPDSTKANPGATNRPSRGEATSGASTAQPSTVVTRPANQSVPPANTATELLPGQLSRERITSILAGNTLDVTEDGDSFKYFHARGGALMGSRFLGSDGGNWTVTGDNRYCRRWNEWHGGRRQCFNVFQLGKRLSFIATDSADTITALVHTGRRL